MADQGAIPDQETTGPTASGADDGLVQENSPATDDSTPPKLANRPPPRAERLAMVAGVLAVLLLAGLVGELGVRAYQAHNAEAKRNLFVQTARQGAANLTTYNYQRIDADMRRVLALATGSFYDTFSHRTQSFRDLVQQVHSTSVGTVTAAGLESEAGNQGQVLVTVSVQASDLVGGNQQRPQALRMRITVTKMGDAAKVSDVVFVA